VRFQAAEPHLVLSEEGTPEPSILFEELFDSLKAAFHLLSERLHVFRKLSDCRHRRFV